MRITHRLMSFRRLIARSISLLGVLCDFLMNPCRITILPSLMEKIIRPILPSLRLDRTSQSPFSSGRQIGIPTGQPHSSVLKSAPIVRLSSRGKELNPLPDRFCPRRGTKEHNRNALGRFRHGLLSSLRQYHFWYTMASWILSCPVVLYCISISICLLYTSPSPRDRTRSRM